MGESSLFTVAICIIHAVFAEGFLDLIKYLPVLGLVLSVRILLMNISMALPTHPCWLKWRYSWAGDVRLFDSNWRWCNFLWFYLLVRLVLQLRDPTRWLFTRGYGKRAARIPPILLSCSLLPVLLEDLIPFRLMQCLISFSLLLLCPTRWRNNLLSYLRCIEWTIRLTCLVFLEFLQSHYFLLDS